MYHVKKSLIGDCVYNTMKIFYGSIRAEIQDLFQKQTQQLSGLITNKTRVIILIFFDIYH